ncbi:MAG: hypothetical protein M2R45_03860 [Verrucomicrobia subdivision 3 bacterium]|nr:hypothetical protein [Limisphaerales bacterium]MCS1415815.1 hypothetical protein [Limisphaerales bacterium]
MGVFRGHGCRIWLLAGSLVGGWFVAISGDNTAKLWDVENFYGGLVCLLGSKVIPESNAFEYSPDVNWFAIGNGGREH